jgi:hypothetical protein
LDFSIEKQRAVWYNGRITGAEYASAWQFTQHQGGDRYEYDQI